MQRSDKDNSLRPPEARLVRRSRKRDRHAPGRAHRHTETVGLIRSDSRELAFLRAETTSSLRRVGGQYWEDLDRAKEVALQLQVAGKTEGL